MRHTFLVLFVAAAVAGPAHAQAPQPATGQSPASAASGWVDFGARATNVSGDGERFERYRDVGDGAFLDRFQWGRATEARLFRVEGGNVGRRDQRFDGLFEQTGRFRVLGRWDQIPLTISRDTRSPYTVEGPGILRIEDSIQIGIEQGRIAV